MSGKMSRADYERLVEQDVAWLLRQPRTLEREHLVQIARQSVEAEYPRRSNGSPIVPLCPTCKASVAVVPSDDKPHPDAVAEHHDCLFPERGARWMLPAVCACVGDGRTGPDDERHVCVPGNACGVAGCATCGGVESTAAEIVAAMPEPLRRLAADPEARARFNGMRVEALSPPGATVTESVIHLSPEMARQLETRGTIPSPRQPAERDGREQAEPAPSLADAVIAALREPGDRLVSPWVVRPSNAHGPDIAQRYEVSASIARLADGEHNRPLSNAMNRADEALRDDGHVLPEDVIRAAVEPWERRHAEEVRRAFLRGFAAALASVQRDFDQATIVENIMRGNGITIADLEAAGVEAFDLNPIRGAL